MTEDMETIDEFLDRHSAYVEDVLRHAADVEIMPRFCRLADHEVQQKTGPDDLGTDADRLAEKYLTERLRALLPGSLVVGEEAVHTDPATDEAIREDAPVWIIDPVHGTGSSSAAKPASAPLSPWPGAASSSRPGPTLPPVTSSLRPSVVRAPASMANHYTRVGHSPATT